MTFPPFRLSTSWIAALGLSALVLLPFDLVAGTKLTGWDWPLVLLALLAINLVPFLGQAVCLALAAVGAYHIGLDHLAQRGSAAPTPTATTRPTPPPVQATEAPAPATDFATWRRTVGARAIQDNCLQKSQSQGLVDTRQIEQIARVCACYGAAASTVITEADVVGDRVKATAEFNTRLGDEARRICQSAR